VPIRSNKAAGLLVPIPTFAVNKLIVSTVRSLNNILPAAAPKPNH
jgi:hypothetical protein